jgi:hypothetical protein
MLLDGGARKDRLAQWAHEFDRFELHERVGVLRALGRLFRLTHWDGFFPCLGGSRHRHGRCRLGSDGAARRLSTAC